MTSMIPYTHWAYFDDRSAAEACAKELEAWFDCLVAIDPNENPAPRFGPWLLRAARSVDIDTHWHEAIEVVVEHHGGSYDGGESGWMDFTPDGVVYLDAGKDA